VITIGIEFASAPGRHDTDNTTTITPIRTARMPEHFSTRISQPEGTTAHLAK
jgi:hypothetical protein